MELSVPRLRIWCGRQRVGSWMPEPLQAPVTRVGCGDLATRESLPGGWTLYMFWSSEPREVGTRATGLLGGIFWPAPQGCLACRTH